MTSRSKGLEESFQEAIIDFPKLQAALQKVNGFLISIKLEYQFGFLRYPSIRAIIRIGRYDDYVYTADSLSELINNLLQNHESKQRKAEIDAETEQKIARLKRKSMGDKSRKMDQKTLDDYTNQLFNSLKEIADVYSSCMTINNEDIKGAIRQAYLAGAAAQKQADLAAANTRKVEIKSTEYRHLASWIIEAIEQAEVK
jgi:hypothetical protein